MRRFCFIGSAIISVFCCCTFLPAQENVNYQEFVEAEIALSDTLTIADIEALPKAPGSSIETLNDGSTVRVQIPAAAAQELADNGVQITIIRSFLLVQNVEPVLSADEFQTMATTSYAYEENPSDVPIPTDGSFIGSGIDFSAYSANIITSIEVHCAIQSSDYGLVYAELTDYPETAVYSLVSADDGYISVTRTGVTTFNGKTLNRQWVLWAREVNSFGGGYIDSWWLKIYYEGTPSYCGAVTANTGFEYISRVVVGSINNSSGDSGYTDYTGLSTSMNIGTGYPITVTNGNPYLADGCGIWVDWNQDLDFDDTGETISVSGSPGNGPYTATITPPASAVAGDTRMRVRIVDTSYNSLLACGQAGYGEVEDYTINVADSAPPTLKVSGYVTHRWDDSPVSGVLLEIYNGSFPHEVPSGLTDISDGNGYYEIEVPSPWTGYVKATKTHYAFNWATNFNNVTTDQIQDFSAYYTYSGGFGSSGSPYLIATTEDMNAIGNHSEDWGQYFKMTADIDLSDYTGTQFKIIGTSSTNAFAGVFDGNNHTISNFRYSTSSAAIDSIGLFGYVKYSISHPTQIKNLHLVDSNVVGIGPSKTASLVGFLDSGYVINCHVDNGYVNGTLAGGLVAENSGTINNSHFNGNIVCTSGGGITQINDGSIYKCYSQGNISAALKVGGLVAQNPSSGHITNCYSSCNVSATGTIDAYCGGLIGQNTSGVFVEDCYSTGRVSGTAFYIGGFAGYVSSSAFDNCFWDIQTSQRTNGIKNGTLAEIVGKTTDLMQTKSTFSNTGWDFVNIWKICEGTGYPKLTWQESLPGDFACPDGVDFVDYAILAKQWMLEKLSYDVSPAGGDGIVDFSDFAVFANSWQGDMIQLSEFMSQWLQPGVYNADIAPLPNGDGVVDEFDFALFAENWLVE